MAFESFKNDSVSEKPEPGNRPERRRNVVEIARRSFGIDVKVTINPDERDQIHV